jgi:hypothetical protein
MSRAALMFDGLPAQVAGIDGVLRFLAELPGAFTQGRYCNHICDNGTRHAKKNVACDSAL